MNARRHIEFEAKVIQAQSALKDLGEVFDSLQADYHTLWGMLDRAESKNEQLAAQNQMLNTRLQRLRRRLRQEAAATSRMLA